MKSKVVKLSEIGEFKNGLNFNQNDYGFGFPIINVKQLYQSRFATIKKLLEIKSDFAKKIEGYFVDTGDLLFVRGSMDPEGAGQLVMVNKFKPKTVFSGFIIRFRITDRKIINPLFLTYLLRSPPFRELFVRIASGSVHSNMNQEILGNIQVELPDIQIQNQISKVLDDIDTKIELLQNQNKILEQIIQTIFKSWFMDFAGVTKFEDSELGEIPKEWEIKKLDELFQIFAGGDLSKISFSKTKSNEYRYPVYSNSLKKKGLYGYSKTYQYEPECVTVTARGEVGRAEYRNNFFNAIVRLLVLKPKYDFSCSYTASFINSELDFSHIGSAVNQLTAPGISDRVIVVPPSNLLENFERIFYPLQKKIDLNTANISILEQTRDTLLPKLMSGEIRV